MLLHVWRLNITVRSASAGCILRDLWINIQKRTCPDKIPTHIRNIPILLSNFRGRRGYDLMRCGNTVTVCGYFHKARFKVCLHTNKVFNILAPEFSFKF
jgi:hypothetical protein